MKKLLELLLLGLAASACLLMLYWAWQELAHWWGGRYERRARRRALREPAAE